MACNRAQAGQIRMEDFNKESKRIANMPPEELEKNVEGINWNQLAKTHV